MCQIGGVESLFSGGRRSALVDLGSFPAVPRLTARPRSTPLLLAALARFAGQHAATRPSGDYR